MITSLPRKRNIGSARLIDTASTNDGTTVTLREPGTNQFWLLATGVGSSASWYIPGASQDASRDGYMLVQQHQGTTGWQSVAISILKKVPGASWSSTINLNMTSTTSEMAYGLLMEQIGPFLGQLVRSYRVGVTSAATTCTVTCPSNTSPFPGGIAVAAAYEDTGGAGPTSVTGVGWEAYFVGLLGVAIYTLPTSHIETPPSPVFTSSRSDTWAGCMAYIR